MLSAVEQAESATKHVATRSFRKRVRLVRLGWRTETPLLLFKNHMSKKPKKPAQKTASQPAPKDKLSGQGLQPALYLVATPIGHAKDISLRELEVLRSADFIFCEDTRQTQKLLMIHGIEG